MGWLALLEREVLGRTRPDAERAVREALAVCGQDPWCDGFVRLGRYASPLDQLVQRTKANAWHDVAEAFGRALARELADSVRPNPRAWCVVPVPTSPLRRLGRGIDHSAVMARAVSRELGLSFCPCLRSRLAPRQASLTGRDRRRRVQRFAWRRGWALPKGVSVVLVDDVRTTGSTLREARELLIQRGSARVLPAVVCAVD
jgi:ComF family protein